MQEPMPGGDLLSAAQSTLPPPEDSSPSAGSLLRQAREAAHIHAEILAGNLKVPLQKIQALENDDWAALPDVAFTRALASTVCRQLKIAPEPILALLPSVRQQAPEVPATLAEDKALSAARQKLLNSPSSGKSWRWLMGTLVAALLLSTVFWIFNTGQIAALQAALPTQPLKQTPAESKPRQSAEQGDTNLVALSAAQAQGGAAHPLEAVPTMLTETAALGQAQATAVPAPSLSTPTPSAAPVAGLGNQALLELHANAECWVQVRDAQKKVQISRLLQAGEKVQIQTNAPYQLWAGRAEALQIRWQGQPLAVFAGKTGSQRAQLPPVLAATLAPERR